MARLLTRITGRNDYTAIHILAIWLTVLFTCAATWLFAVN